MISKVSLEFIIISAKDASVIFSQAKKYFKISNYFYKFNRFIIK
jgi:hypothetical protein